MWQVEKHLEMDYYGSNGRFNALTYHHKSVYKFRTRVETKEEPNQINPDRENESTKTETQRKEIERKRNQTERGTQSNPDRKRIDQKRNLTKSRQKENQPEEEPNQTPIERVNQSSR